MAVYFANTEITGIKDLFPLTAKDITGLYFADTELFTVWDTYDGTLPATYSANGSMLADYRVYGSAGGVGDRTVNLLSTSWTNGFLLGTDGGLVSNTNYHVSDYINTVPGTYVFSVNITLTSNTVVRIWEYEANDTPKQMLYSESSSPGKKSFTVTSSTGRIRISTIKAVIEQMLVEGSTAPAEYVPYGYEVDISVRSENLFDYSDLETGSISISDGTNVNNAAQKRTEHYINVSPSSQYIFRNANGNVRVHEYTLSNAWIGSILIPTDASYVASSNTAKIRLAAMTESFDAQMLLCQFFTTNPIYIGSDPLSEDEYVSFKEQKVYRRTENLFNKSNAEIGSITFDGRDFESTQAIRSDYMPVLAGETYYVNVYDGFYFQYCAGYNGTRFVTEIVLNTPPIPSKQAIIIPENVDSIRIVFRKSSTTPYPGITDVNLINATVTSLQPEDPPVPLPALPTVDGVNVVDYAGQSAAVPSRFYAKYRKEGFK